MFASAAPSWGPLLGLWVAGTAVPAAAISMTFPLTVVLDEGQTGEFGSITIEEQGGKLNFNIALGPDLGPDADLHELYFNLVDTLDVDLEISHFQCRQVDESQLGSCKRDFKIEDDPDVEDGAGADFDFGVNFGDGEDKKGNGLLAELSFKLAGDGDDDHKGKPDDDDVTIPLTIADLLESSETKRGIEVFFAVHAESTDLDDTKSHSETVAQVPEPGSAALFGVGLLGLAVAGRRRS